MRNNPEGLLANGSSNINHRRHKAWAVTYKNVSTANPINIAPIKIYT